ncbi:PLP-dependent aminotransferase family protein [Thalassomonas actiniarum]|uniref:PLP-dependent aminotransferase family protein n=1 Tax=Thalassomonas actiniarum TaxID=485447 RepID=A0AAE9YQI4_9GAMM|nr:PLP-dependent aminotransferase family protein [Thalassomonas actiniarum]WDD99365.1 PLP-dependent aminotransferase family protein [Thalassomonas actiniarum]
MKDLMLTLDPAIKPGFLRIAAAIRDAITSDQIRANESLPSARKLAERLNTNRHTIMAAYQELIAQGWVSSRQRQGYRVAADLPVQGSRKVAGAGVITDKTFNWHINPIPQVPMGSMKALDFHYNFAGGLPDIESFPFQEFKSYMADSLARPDIFGLGYGNNNGDGLFIEQVTTYLRRVRGITDKDIIAVNGSQEALYLISRLLLKPGDKVAVESLGYRPAWNAFKTAGAELLAIRQHKSGIDIEQLESLFKQHQVRLIYLTPLHQYPTTVTLPITERQAIYRLAAQYNVAIIEDDYDHEYHYQSQPLTPMAADDPLGLVLYLSTFSKIMFPGARIGFIAVDKSLAADFLNYRSIVNHKPNVLMQSAIGRWMKDGAFERHLRRTGKKYQQRRDNLVQQLNRYRQQGIALDFHQPAGGMALWLDIGQGAGEIEAYAKARDVFLLGESHFHLLPENDENRYIRLGFAAMDEEKLNQGLKRVFGYFS